MTEILKGQHKI